MTSADYQTTTRTIKKANGKHFTRTLLNKCVFPKLFVVCGLEKREQKCSDEIFAISNKFDFEEHSDYENTVCLQGSRTFSPIIPIAAAKDWPSCRHMA